MIIDSLEHLKRYQVPHAEQILKFIAQHDCLKLSNEQIDIDGEDLFVRVMEYEPKPAIEKEFETHRRYADLQYIASGIEIMQTAPQKVLKPTKGYDSKGDYQFYQADELINEFVVEQGHFVVFFPGEAHRPSCLYKDKKSLVKKLVFKIKFK